MSVKSESGGGARSESGGGVRSVSSGGVRSVERGADYESLTLTRLRQAEERKRLLQDLSQEEPS